MDSKLNLTKSLQLFQESLKLLPAGTSSNARLWKTACPIYTPCTIFIDRAKGSHMWDVDGNEYIDYRLGYGPIILGHGYKPVYRAVHKADKSGIVYALGNKLEIDVVKRMSTMVPGVEMVRFSNSGTEATMSAIRIARGYTKKNKIIKFEGHFHGTHDYLLFSTDFPYSAPKKPISASLGIPKDISKLVLVEEWNNFEAIERTVKKHHKDVAAIITEPIMGNAGGIMPREGYLKHLLELCERYGIVLIFDEVKTGFRISPGGAQEFFKVRPHLSTFAKSLGNGYPIAAVGGLKDIMEVVGPGKVVHGGTFSANAIALTAANATMKELCKEAVYDHLEWFGSKLMKGISECFADHKIDHLVQGHPAMFQFLFTRRERIYHYRDLAACDFNLYAKLHYELLKRGIMIDEDNGEVIFTSYSHSKSDLDQTITAFRDAVHDALIQRSPLIPPTL
ncbi:aspartate aminotransferase family protein [Candidatus Woesearchaeota archaeon]|nr:aspartate aminotransferase family protein [Candidatus Woesearchaeota archaeon]